MKKTSILIIILLPIIFYLCGAFISARLDFRYWSEMGRFMYIMITVFSITISTIFNENLNK